MLHEVNHGIRYQYAVPEYDPSYIPRYQWQYIDWDPCTDPCSGGAQVSSSMLIYKPILSLMPCAFSVIIIILKLFVTIFLLNKIMYLK